MKISISLSIMALVAMIVISGCSMFCTQKWQCTAWSQCNIAGTQSRTCTDDDSCGSVSEKPLESQSCTPQTTAQAVSPIIGHPFSVGGHYYDSDPNVPLITQTDVNSANLRSATTISNYNDFQDFYNQYEYQCISLKNEGTAAYTTAQSASTGTFSQEQLLNFYNVAENAIQREANCQESIRVFQNHQFSIFETSPSTQLYNELNTNMQITLSDENIEIKGYNSVASNFNSAIQKCPSSDQIIGIDSLCHNICGRPSINSLMYCPDSTCVSGTCLKCLPGFQLTENNNCIQI